MKTKVLVRLKPGVLDVQGKAIEKGLHDLGYGKVHDVRVGKLIEFSVDGATPAEAKKQVEAMCKTLLTNTVIENFEIVTAE